MKATARLGMYCLIAAALAGAPAFAPAQEAPAKAEKAEAKPARAIPFKGKLKSIDPTARTISFGETTLHIDDRTKILKQEQPATLSDGVVGEPVMGTYRKDGSKATAVLVRFGPKTATAPKAAASKSEKP